MTISIINDKDKEQLKDIVPAEYLTPDNLCICALEEDTLCAVLVAAAVSEQEWDIRWIYVYEEYRRQGIAGDMLELLKMSIRLYGIQALSMQLLCSEEDDELAAFAQKSGFTIWKSTAVYSSSLSAACIALARYEEKPVSQDRMVCLKDMTNKEWYVMLLKLDELRKIAGERENVYIRPASRDSYEDDISFVALNRDGSPAAIMLVRYNGVIEICFLCNLNKNDPRLTIRILKRVCEAAEDKYPECEVVFHAANPMTEKIGMSLLKRQLKKTGDVLYMVSYL